MSRRETHYMGWTVETVKRFPEKRVEDDGINENRTHAAEKGDSREIRERKYSLKGGYSEKGG